jgi:hypothetical protein
MGKEGKSLFLLHYRYTVKIPLINRSLSLSHSLSAVSNKNFARHVDAFLDLFARKSPRSWRRDLDLAEKGALSARRLFLWIWRGYKLDLT